MVGQDQDAPAGVYDAAESLRFDLLNDVRQCHDSITIYSSDLRRQADNVKQ